MVYKDMCYNIYERGANLEKTYIYVVSDSLGETGELLAKAAAIHFNSSIGDIHKFPFTFEKAQIDNILEQASREKSLILHTLVLPELRDYLQKKSMEKNIISIDIIGPILESLTGLTGREPRREVGLNRRLNEEYFKKVEAVEFAVKYDDGKDPRGILKADIVLIGISRTSKTPLSMYLAYRNVKVANIPLVPEVAPPKELFDISPKKIIGLTNDPDKLNSIRTERLKEMGVKSSSNYAQMDRILRELEFADNLFSKLRCPVINVSSKAIEETASIILSII